MSEETGGWNSETDGWKFMYVWMDCFFAAPMEIAWLNFPYHSVSFCTQLFMHFTLARVVLAQSGHLFTVGKQGRLLLWSP